MTTTETMPTKPVKEAGGAASPEALSLEDGVERLRAVFAGQPEAVVALSGGVDSLTLSAFAVQELGEKALLVHAVSPAVPAAATARVKTFAADRHATLVVMDAGEFSDEAYRANPLNRCYFCKSHLYDAIRSRFKATIFSGTNFDDLGDFRPGLLAAKERDVRHPFVEAGLTKARVRELARALGLGDLAELPSAPCLSSRVETGIRIEAGALAFIDEMEAELRKALDPETVRCRIRPQGVSIEVDQACLEALSTESRRIWTGRIAARAAAAGLRGEVRFERYRQGSAFLRPAP